MVCGSDNVDHQKLVNWINHKLDAYGSTIDLRNHSRQALGNDTQLGEFLKALEKLEAQFSAQTSHLSWSAHSLGWRIARDELALLPLPLMRHALWRLCSAVTGRALGGDLLTEVCSELAEGKTARHTLPGGFALVLAPQSLVLEAR